MSLAAHLQVMVVDDTSVSRMFLLDSLDQMGVKNVRVSKNGKEALAALMQAPVHLVISDMNMPEMDGLALLAQLRAFKPTAKVGFILVTGSTDKSLIERGAKLGMNNFIAKPFTPQVMKRTIEAVVGPL